MKLGRRQISKIASRIMVAIHHKNRGYTQEQIKENERLMNKFNEGHDLCANIEEILSGIDVRPKRKK